MPAPKPTLRVVRRYWSRTITPPVARPGGSGEQFSQSTRLSRYGVTGGAFMRVRVDKLLYSLRSCSGLGRGDVSEPRAGVFREDPWVVCPDEEDIQNCARGE